ncbi:MAG: hypothetical protein ACREQ9_25280 [Candidatus Binatia bacterium]
MISPPTRRRARRFLLGAVAILYVVSIPWYRDAQAPLRLWLGVPDWVLVAFGSYLAAACLNALAWLLTDIPDRAAANGEEP